ncbi:methylglyoxal reductase (NADPH-dependent) gre2 [Tulasnella sp. 403]|nr:methylglyoxal reductase (NADPH-dependent) gre2 [Tulasnella sp. 403]
MPAIAAPSKILVTGANGYIAAHVIKSLLRDNFSVRGAVRSASKGKYFKDLFASHEDRFEYFVIPDISSPTAYDEAVRGVSGILHLASPLPKEVEDAKEIVSPIVDGTHGLFESVRKYAPGVKRIIVTSSTVAALEPKEGLYMYSEADWNDAAVKALEEQGSKASGVTMYEAGKVLEERAIFEYVEKNEGKIGFDVVTILPTWVFGPMIHELGPFETLGFGSFKALYYCLTEQPALYERMEWNWVG